MWQSSNNSKPSRGGKKASLNPGIDPFHLKRVQCDLKVGGLGAPQELIEARALLNDLSPVGIGIYTAQGIRPGDEATLTIAQPKPFFVKGLVVWCHELEPSKRIISVNSFPYRIGVRFLFQNDEERETVRKFCLELAYNYPGRDLLAVA